jgi:hypothetical protein
MQWLRRYLEEKEPTLKNFADVVRELEQRQVARITAREAYRARIARRVTRVQARG